MNNYRLVRENFGRIEDNNRIINLKSNNIDDVKKWLIDNNLQFVRYSTFSDTIYYK